MFKKTIAILLVGLLLNSGYVFAQTDSDSIASLKKTQTQARQSYNSIQEELKGFTDHSLDEEAIVIVSLYALGVALAAGGGFAVGKYVGAKQMIQEAVSIKSAAEVNEAKAIVKAEEATMEVAALKAQIQEQNEVINLLQSISTRGVTEEYSLEYLFVRKEIDRALSTPEWTTEQALNRFFQQNFGNRHYSAEEAQFIVNYIKHLREHPVPLFGSAQNLKPLFKELQASAAKSLGKGSFVADLLTAATLKKAGFVGLTLLLFSTLANTDNPEDAKITGRLINNPLLFLQANETEITELAQNTMAREWCEELAEGLSKFAALSLKDKKAIVEAVIKTDPRRLAKKDVMHSLRKVIKPR